MKENEIIICDRCNGRGELSVGEECYRCKGEGRLRVRLVPLKQEITQETRSEVELNMADIVRVIVAYSGEKFEGVNMIVIDPGEMDDMITLTSVFGTMKFNKNRIFPAKVMYVCEKAEMERLGR